MLLFQALYQLFYILLPSPISLPKGTRLFILGMEEPADWHALTLHAVPTPLILQAYNTVIRLIILQTRFKVWRIEIMSQALPIPIAQEKQRVRAMYIGILRLFENGHKVFEVLAILSGLYLVCSLFEIHTLVNFAIFIISIYAVLYYRWKLIRQRGIINLMNPRLRDILLNRSIFDLYRDQVYYPLTTKILALFIKGAVAKPHPEELEAMFDDLPENVKNTIFTKGLLKLAPSAIEKTIIEKDVEIEALITEKKVVKQELHEIVPKSYGKIDRNWDRIIQYEAQSNKIHEDTIVKQALLNLNNKIHWKHIIPLACLVSGGVMKMKTKKLTKIFLYNGSTFGILVLLVLLIIKYKKPEYKKVAAK